VWRCIRAAIAGAGVVALPTWGRAGHYAIIGLIQLAKTIVNVYVHNGEDACYKMIKKSCDVCRSSALENLTVPSGHVFAKRLNGCLRGIVSSEKGRIQLSMIGRSLPLGTDSKLIDSLHDHREALTSTHRTPEHVLERAYLFAEKWTKKFVKLRDLNDLQVHYSNGSCLTHTRA